MLDEYNNVLDTLLNNTEVITANTDHNNFVLDPSITIITITDTDFNNVRKVKIISSFSTSSLTEHVDIYSYYTMDVSLSAKFRKILSPVNERTFVLTRGFDQCLVLYPLQEISPNWKHPKTNELISTLIENISKDDKNSILKVKKS